MHKMLKTGALCVMFLSLVGCSVPAPSPTSGTPLASPLNSPIAQPSVSVAPLPTQDPTLGSVIGTLLEQGQPVAGRVLYLAEVVKDASGKETAAGYDRANSPRTTLQADGSFRFVNVPPGRYSLVMDLVRQAYMLKNPKDQSDLIADVKVGGTANLGVLDFTQLPK